MTRAKWCRASLIGCTLAEGFAGGLGGSRLSWGGPSRRARPHPLVCFFFQAEDGIRDYKVTGVQTCALPISFEVKHPPPGGKAQASATAEQNGLLLECTMTLSLSRRLALAAVTVAPLLSCGEREVGRASCRGRG